MAQVIAAFSLLLKGARRLQLPHRASLVAVWREALSPFSAHSEVMLSCALIGFVAPVILGNLFYTGAKLSEYARTRAVVTLYDRPSLAALLIQAGLGVLALTFARGLITWLTLFGRQRSEDGSAHGNFGAACRATFARFPALLASSLLYSALIAAGFVAMSEFTKGLEFAPNKLAHVWAGPLRAFGDVIRQLVWRGFNMLLPGFFVVERTELVILGAPSNLASDTWLTALAGMTLIFLAETLLHFRTVMVMKSPRSPRPQRPGWFAPLIDSARLGVSHFGTVLLHIGTVRLAIFALSVLLIEFPMAMMGHFVLPNIMRYGGGFELLPIVKFVSVSASALVSGILLAFSTVYDARLVEQLGSYPVTHVADTTSAPLLTRASSWRVEHQLD